MRAGLAPNPMTGSRVGLWGTTKRKVPLSGPVSRSPILGAGDRVGLHLSDKHLRINTIKTQNSRGLRDGPGGHRAEGCVIRKRWMIAGAMLLHYA